MYRRDFLKTASAATAFAFSLSSSKGAVAGTAAESDLPQDRKTLSLSVSKRTLDVNGKSAEVYGLVQPDGTHGVRLDAEGLFDVELANRIGEPTLIHWHGLTPPWNADGVPNNPAALLKPAETRSYRFPVGAGGTHWMHAHTLQEQRLLAAPLIVRTAEDRKQDEQEVVILLHDFSFASPEELLAKLKGPAGKAANAMNHNMMGHMMPKDEQSMSDMPMMSMMGGMDLNDIDYDAYLANDRTLDDPEVVAVDRNGTVRLRIINGATATAFTIDLGGITGTVISVDGQAIKPVNGKTFPITMGQRLDIRLRIPMSGGSFPVLALREGGIERTGIVLATKDAAVSKLATRGDIKGGVLNLGFEASLSPLNPLVVRKPDREYDLTLAGNMQSYEWVISGADDLSADLGDRLEFTIGNMSMMAHPMHLHGHHFQVVGINGMRFEGAVRDTVLIPPMQQVTLAFDANNPGSWPFHCHHLYHMASGMMAFVKYEKMG
ncbi:MAG: multicopper oxidase family protein [Rhizobium sp.]|nr:multicopper oxidase family protein [Rhizobium sp.]